MFVYVGIPLFRKDFILLIAAALSKKELKDLLSFEMNMNLCYELIPLIPNGKIIVAESGIYEHGQLEDLGKAGVDAFLVGESLMRQDNVEKALKTLKYGN